MIYKKKICNTLKDINTRKYTSLEEASSKEEEGSIFTGGDESRVNLLIIKLICLFLYKSNQI